MASPDKSIREYEHSRKRALEPNDRRKGKQQPKPMVCRCRNCRHAKRFPKEVYPEDKILDLRLEELQIDDTVEQAQLKCCAQEVGLENFLKPGGRKGRQLRVRSFEFLPHSQAVSVVVVQNDDFDDWVYAGDDEWDLDLYEWDEVEDFISPENGKKGQKRAVRSYAEITRRGKG